MYGIVSNAALPARAAEIYRDSIHRDIVCASA